ncbi:unnamed protein product, partial [Effrenium voratum]
AVVDPVSPQWLAKKSMVRRDGKVMKETAQPAYRLEAFKRTRLCKFHLSGNCVRGTSCNFAHSVEQIRDQPDFSKTRLCVDFSASKWCRDGAYCKFAHGDNELRAHPSAKRKDNQAADAQVPPLKSSTWVPTQEPSLKSSTWASSEEQPLKSAAWVAPQEWYYMPEAMEPMMYPWLPYLEYQFAHEEVGWDATSQLSAEWNEWNEWNPASSNNSTTCTDSPVQSHVVSSVPDSPLLDHFELPECALFHDEVRVKNTFLHIDVDESEDEDEPFASRSMRRSPSAPCRLAALGGHD